MKSFKLFIALCLMAFSFQLFAQGEGRSRRSAEERTENQVARLNEKLSFSEDQLSKVKEIHLQFNQNLDKARETNEGERDAIRSEMKKLHQTRKEELKAVLTEEQWTTFEEMEKENRGNRFRNGRKGKGKKNAEDESGEF